MHTASTPTAATQLHQAGTNDELRSIGNNLARRDSIAATWKAFSHVKNALAVLLAVTRKQSGKHVTIELDWKGICKGVFL